MATMDYSKSSPFSEREGEYLDSSVTSGPDLVAYGDSLTYGEGAATVDYPALLATYTERTVINAGVRAEKSSDVAGRQGASPLIAVITGGVIPVSGGVGLTVKRSTDNEVSADFTRLNNYQVNPVIIAGVEGTLTNVAGSYTFTRSVEGIAVTADRPLPISTYSARTYGKSIHIIWAGTNNWLETDQVMGDVAAMIENMDALNKRYLVLGPLNRSNHPSGGADHTAIVALEQRLAKQYGRRFINVRRYLIDYGLSDAGITATATDTTNISQDIIPDSLRFDSVHLKNSGYAIVSQQVADRLYEFGWVTQPEPLEVPTFDPLSFPETHLWYDPSTGTNEAIVTTLDDKSTNNFDTVTVSGTPKFSSVAIDGTPGIVFDGASWIKSPIFTTLGSVPVTIIFNAISTTTVTSQYYVDGGTSPNVLAVFRTNGLAGQYGIRRNSSAGSSTGGVIDNMAHTFVAVFNGANSALYIDGVMVASGDQGTVSAGTQIILGGYGGSTPAQLLKGAIGDYVLIKKALTVPEIADASYWGQYRRTYEG